MEKHSESRLSYFFAHLHLLPSHSFSSLIFSLLFFSSLTLPASAIPSVHIVGRLISKLPSINNYTPSNSVGQQIKLNKQVNCFASLCIIEKKATGWRILFLGGTRICQGFVIFYQVAGDMNMDVCRRPG